MSCVSKVPQRYETVGDSVDMIYALDLSQASPDFASDYLLLAVTA